MKSRYLFRTAFLGLMLGAVAAIGAAQAADPLKIGLLEDVSGDLAVFGITKLHGSQLAVEEINKGGRSYATSPRPSCAATPRTRARLSGRSSI
jgi:branched-chain amino acid transport system substrate-binding protein